jgi:peptidoglycan/LPS O-acetylase OafA/YrhL
MRFRLSMAPKYYNDVVYLGDVDKGRKNNLNLIRFLLASSVILSHSWVSLGLLASEPLHHYLEFVDIGTIAVYGFFFISGYLILKSALRWSGPGNFIASRFLRIFPGLFITVTLCVFIFGPAITTSSLRVYFSSPLTRSFLSEMWMHRMQHILPGVCEGYPLPWINAALWTLPGEWCMYIATMLVCLGYRWRSLKQIHLGVWVLIIARFYSPYR